MRICIQVCFYLFEIYREEHLICKIITFQFNLCESILQPFTLKNQSGFETDMRSNKRCSLWCSGLSGWVLILIKILKNLRTAWNRVLMNQDLMSPKPDLKIVFKLLLIGDSFMFDPF